MAKDASRTIAEVALSRAERQRRGYPAIADVLAQIRERLLAAESDVVVKIERPK